MGQWGSTCPEQAVWHQDQSLLCPWICWIHSLCMQRWGRIKRGQADGTEKKEESVLKMHLIAGVFFCPSPVWSTASQLGWSSWLMPSPALPWPLLWWRPTADCWSTWRSSHWASKDLSVSCFNFTSFLVIQSFHHFKSSSCSWLLSLFPVQTHT